LTYVFSEKRAVDHTMMTIPERCEMTKSSQLMQSWRFFFFFFFVKLATSTNNVF